MNASQQYQVLFQLFDPKDPEKLLHWLSFELVRENSKINLGQHTQALFPPPLQNMRQVAKGKKLSSQPSSDVLISFTVHFKNS